MARRSGDVVSAAEAYYADAAAKGLLFVRSDNTLIYLSGGRPEYITSGAAFQGPGSCAAPLPAPLTYAESLALYKCHTAKRHLPRVDLVVTDPRVVLTPDGPQVTRPGHNAIGDHYIYQIPGAGYPPEPSDSIEHLTKCFSCVPFSQPHFRANLLAWLLSGLVIDIRAPLLVVNGSGQRTGKTCTVDAVGWILNGKEPGRNSTKGEEAVKNMAARFRRGERLVFFDNLVTKRAFDNETIAALLTGTGSQELRILGTNDFATSQDAMVAFTVNSGQFSADLTQRSLLVNLYRETFGPFEVFPPDYAAEHRTALYSELLGLALRPAEPVPLSYTPGFRFRKWLNFVVPRIEPVFGPLYLETQAVDAAMIELFSGWGEANRDCEFTAADLVTSVHQSGAERFPTLFDELSDINERARTRKAAVILKNCVNRAMVLDSTSSIRLIKTQGATEHAGARYKFMIETNQ